MSKYICVCKPNREGRVEEKYMLCMMTMPDMYVTVNLNVVHDGVVDACADMHVCIYVRTSFEREEVQDT